MSKTPGCFDSVFEIILRISWAGAFKGCFPSIAELHTAPSEFVFMFSLDTKALNKRLYHCVNRQLSQPHMDDRDYETYFYIFTCCVQLLLLLS